MQSVKSQPCAKLSAPRLRVSGGKEPKPSRNPPFRTARTGRTADSTPNQPCTPSILHRLRRFRRRSDGVRPDLSGSAYREVGRSDPGIGIPRFPLPSRSSEARGFPGPGRTVERAGACQLGADVLRFLGMPLMGAKNNFLTAFTWTGCFDSPLTPPKSTLPS